MSIEKEVYNLSTMTRVIDLNKNMVTYDIEFSVRSENGEPFSMAVVDKTTLENSTSIDFKQVESGQITSNLVQDKQVYQNYLLLLKSDVGCKCEVVITRKELPVAPVSQPLKKKSGGLKFLVIILIIIGGGILLYYFYRSFKKNNEENFPSSKGEEIGKSNYTENDYLPTSRIPTRFSNIRRKERISSPNPFVDRIKNL